MPTLAPLQCITVLQFYQNDSQVEPFAVHFGSSIRPVVVSAGRTLYMTFRPDVGINARADNMGFRARYEFIRGNGKTLAFPLWQTADTNDDIFPYHFINETLNLYS